MDDVYGNRFPGYYICIDEYALETGREWQNCSGFPIQVMYPDYIELKGEKMGKKRGFAL